MPLSGLIFPSNIKVKMNKFEELASNVDALDHVVKFNTSFFAPISSFTKKLKSITDRITSECKQTELLFLAKKIDGFFGEYRCTDDGLYLPPTEADSNDSTAREIIRLVLELNQLSEGEFNELVPNGDTLSKSSLVIDRPRDKNKIFIVHGHDDLAKQEMARLITDLGFEPIILHEQANGGRTIIEKIEEYSNVGFAVVLYTPCDKGGKDAEPLELKSRARQNVIFEHGYLIGKLGRGNVCALVRGSVETPNDISGVVYLPIDAHGAWKYALADEMASSGYNVDKNKVKA